MNDLPEVCPNDKQPITFWTTSRWHDGEFITEYWRGCPDYWDAENKNEHWGKWRSTSWPDAVIVTREYFHPNVPRWIEFLLGHYVTVTDYRG